jgi:Ca2+-binding RTX toxin-like protein
MKMIRLVLDPLDHRVLPAAALANGLLTIDGTEGRDVIVLRHIKDQLSVRGQLIDLNGTLVKSVPVASVTQIAVATGAGDDYINLAKAKVPTSINAGEGKDFIFGGVNDDVILGGGGNDRITGMHGNDVIFGGMENDRLVGGRGNDQLYGDEGNDFLFGQIGNDDNDGGAGNDRIVGGLGMDHNQGGGGADVILDGHAHNHNQHNHQMAEGVITATDLTAALVTIQTQHGDLVEVHIDPNTVFTWNHHHTTLEALQVGDWAVAKFDAHGATLRIDGEHHSVVTGVVTTIDLATSSVTIQTAAGAFVNVIVGPNTIITRNNHHVSLADFTVGDWAKATLDVHGATLRIDATAHTIDNGHTSVEGIITAIDLHHSSVRIQAPDGTFRTVLIDHHAELVRNDHSVTLDAFHVGDQAKATFDANGVTIRLEATAL